MDSEINFKERINDLRTGILETQEYLKSEQISTIVIVTGFDGAGKGHIIHRLNEWLDPRFVKTHTFWRISDEQKERPYYWKFWNCLPQKGKTALFFGSWYADLIADSVYGDISQDSLTEKIATIRFFERMLAVDGVHIIKFWLHLSQKQQLDTKDDLEKNTQFHWKTQTGDWFKDGHYQKFWETSDYVMNHTHQDCAPWIRVPAHNPHQRDCMVAESFIKSVKNYSESKSRVIQLQKQVAPVPQFFRPSNKSFEFSACTNSKLDKKEYEKQLTRLQENLFDLAWQFYNQKKSVYIVFEGWDAAGKGGCIRRVVQSIDARLFDVIPVSAPTKEELDHHYLWRFWKSIPRAGKMAIYDRSWYGRVLVERVEGFAVDHEWHRAYEEIIEFENQLISPGNILLKFWLDISPETQLKRFQKRQNIPFKRFKLGPEDWRNRSKWNEYQIAAQDMIAKTHSPSAPWSVIQANNKKFARIQVLNSICSSISKSL